MKIRILFFVVLIYIVLFNQVFSLFIFSEVLPNTIDDTNLEYIELYNSWSLELSLSWYMLKDKSWKQYIFSSWNILQANEKKKYFRPETKILLNNIGEEIYLYANDLSLVDSFSYKNSIKWEALNIINLTIENDLEDTSFSWDLDSSWSIDILETLAEDTDDEILVEYSTWDIDSSLNEDTLSWTIINNNDLNIEDEINIEEENLVAQNIEIPDVIFSFQSPTYLLEKDKNIDLYNCDRSREVCKINLDLRGSFTWEFNKNDYECLINFWFISSESNKCNPSSIVLWEWIYEFKIKISSKNNVNNFREKKIKIINEWYIKPVKKSSSSWNKNTKKVRLPIKILDPEIIVQWWLNDNSECSNKNNCLINVRYITKDSNEKCIWDFWDWIYEWWIEQKCNPWYVKYWFWEFNIKLKVYERDNKSNFKESELMFSNKTPLFQALPKVEKGIGQLIIYKVMPNPEWSDNLEYIELINNTDAVFDLNACSLDDIIDGWSNAYYFDSEDSLGIWKKKKYYKEQTKINLNNNGDELNLFCNWKLVDSLVRNFDVKGWYYLDHSRLDVFSWYAKVLDVVDGDTLKIEFNKSKEIETLRLIWIDAPETKHPNMKDEEFWIEVENFLRNKLKWKEILVELDTNNLRDKYSRLLWFVYLDGESFNKKLLELWYAKAYLNYDFKYINEYKETEIVAKENELWIWWNWVIDNSWEIVSHIDNSLVLESIISVQWKIWNNKILNWNSLICYDTCSINFDGSKSEWNIKKYSWDFWNGDSYEWKNPAYIKYDKFWNYKVQLIISSSDWNIDIGVFYINFTKSIKKEKISTVSVIDKVEASTNNIKDEIIVSESSTNTFRVILYILIFIFWLVFIFLILRKEKLF